MPFLPLWDDNPVVRLRFQFVTVALSDAVAWWAHIGGFVAGLLLLPLFRWRRAAALASAA